MQSFLKSAIVIAGLAAVAIGWLFVTAKCGKSEPLPVPTPTVPPTTVPTLVPTAKPTSTPTPTPTPQPTPYATAPDTVRVGEPFVLAYFPLSKGGRYSVFVDSRWFVGELGFRSTDKARTLHFAAGLNAAGKRVLEIREGDTVVYKRAIEVVW